MRVLLIDKRPALVAVLVWLVAGVLLALSANQPADASTPRAGRYCAAKELGQQRAGYVCAWKGSHRRWQRQAQATTPPAAPRPSTATVTRVVTTTAPGPTVTVTETTHVECSPVTSPVRLLHPLRIEPVSGSQWGWTLGLTLNGVRQEWQPAEVKVYGRVKGATAWTALPFLQHRSPVKPFELQAIVWTIPDRPGEAFRYDALRLIYHGYAAELGLPIAGTTGMTTNTPTGAVA